MTQKLVIVLTALLATALALPSPFGTGAAAYGRRRQGHVSSMVDQFNAMATNDPTHTNNNRPVPSSDQLNESFSVTTQQSPCAKACNRRPVPSSDQLNEAFPRHESTRDRSPCAKNSCRGRDPMSNNPSLTNNHRPIPSSDQLPESFSVTREFPATSRTVVRKCAPPRPGTLPTCTDIACTGPECLEQGVNGFTHSPPPLDPTMPWVDNGFTNTPREPCRKRGCRRRNRNKPTTTDFRRPMHDVADFSFSPTANDPAQQLPHDLLMGEPERGVNGFSPTTNDPAQQLPNDLLMDEPEQGVNGFSHSPTEEGVSPSLIPEHGNVPMDAEQGVNGFTHSPTVDSLTDHLTLSSEEACVEEGVNGFTHSPNTPVLSEDPATITTEEACVEEGVNGFTHSPNNPLSQDPMGLTEPLTDNGVNGFTQFPNQPLPHDPMGSIEPSAEEGVNGFTHSPEDPVGQTEPCIEEGVNGFEHTPTGRNPPTPSEQVDHFSFEPESPNRPADRVPTSTAPCESGATPVTPFHQVDGFNFAPESPSVHGSTPKSPSGTSVPMTPGPTPFEQVDHVNFGPNGDGHVPTSTVPCTLSDPMARGPTPVSPFEDVDHVNFAPNTQNSYSTTTDSSAPTPSSNQLYHF